MAKIVTPGPTKEIYTCYHSGRLVHAAADADTWADWRASVADLLIEAQTNDGDDAGSWPLRGRIQGQPLMYSEFGGPLLMASLAALTLAEPLHRAVLPPLGKRRALRQVIADAMAHIPTAAPERDSRPPNNPAAPLPADVRESRNNLMMLAVAMVRFDETHGHLPAAAIQDRAGKPLLSWRVAILPFTDQQDLYAKLRLDESWDSPHNSKLLERMPALFASPGKPAGKRGETRYVTPVGPGTIFAARATPWSCDAVSMSVAGTWPAHFHSWSLVTSDRRHPCDGG